MIVRDPLPPALLALTFVTGVVDAVSYLALGHVFTANMTGNVVLLGFAVAGAPGLSVARSSTSLVAFLAGAVLGGRVGASMSVARRRWLFIFAASEAGLLFAAAAVCLVVEVSPTSAPTGPYTVIVLSALAMGLRTATVRQLAVPDLTTTVLTLTLTALAADSTLAGGANPRLGRRIGAVVAMAGGAAVGVVLLHAGAALPLALGGACVLLTAALYRRHPVLKAAAGVR